MQNRLLEVLLLLTPSGLLTTLVYLYLSATSILITLAAFLLRGLLLLPLFL